MLFLLLVASNTGTGQNISLQFKQPASLEKIFSAITHQSKYTFIYTQDQLKKSLPVAINVYNGQLPAILKHCFIKQPLSYIIDGNYIVIQAKPPIQTQDPTNYLQSNTTGVVLNELREPIYGATIASKLSEKITAANEKGAFNIRGISLHDTLVISAIGYSTTEVPVDKNFLVITLKQEIFNLEETVVKGYYSSPRKHSTGSVSGIASNEISKQPVSNLMAALQGRIPGLYIKQANGIPGSIFSVQLRGQNSIQNGNSPLFIINGVPFIRFEEKMAQRSVLAANNPFNTIDPTEIERIEVLKDADATAIYGSRGANGVILVTTKKDHSNEGTFDMRIVNGWTKITRGINYLNTVDYLTMRREAFRNDDIFPSEFNAPDLLVWDTNRYTNWKKVLIGNTGHSLYSQVNYTTSGSAIKFRTGASYYRESSVFIGDFYEDRRSIWLSGSYSPPQKRLSIGFDGNYAANKSELPTEDLTAYINLPPNIYIPYENGALVWSSYGTPYKNLRIKNSGLLSRLTASASVKYLVHKNVELKLLAGYNFLHFREQLQIPRDAQNPAFDPVATSTFGNKIAKTEILEPQLSFQKELSPKIKLSLLSGFTWFDALTKSALTDASGYTDNADQNTLAGATDWSTENSRTQYKYLGIYGRLNIIYNSRHLLNITGRRDGSSRFGPEKRLANFGAIGYGFLFSEDAFIKQYFPSLSLGKIKVSYGTAGNDQIGDYQYINSWRSTKYSYEEASTLIPIRLFNPDYSWEQNKKWDAGLELGFYKGKYYLNVDFFKNKTTNQIIRFTLPKQTGFNSILKNIPASVENSGMEVEFKAQAVASAQFDCQLGFNITFLRNVLTKFPDLEGSSYERQYILGEPLNVEKRLKLLRVDPETGIYIFKDKDGNGTIDSRDYYLLPSADPRYYGGFQINFRVKRLEINIFLQGAKQKGIHPVFASQSPVGSLVNQPTAVLNRWQLQRNIASYQRYTQSTTNSAYYPATINAANSDFSLIDASFLRIKNFNLSYSFTEQYLRKLRLTRLLCFIQAQNIITFTKYFGGDPENKAPSALPPVKTLAVGFLSSF